MSRGSRLFLGICGLVGAVLMGMLAPTILQKLYTSSTYLFGPQSTANISTKRVPPPQKPTPSSTRREIGDSADAALYDQAKSPFSIAAMSLIGLIMGIGCGAVLLRFGERSSSRWDKMDVSDRVTFFVGTFAGVIAALPFLMLFSAIGLNIYMPVAVVGLTLGFAALSVYALKSMEDFLPWTKGRIRGRRRGIKLLDTNVIIDGRIYDVARTGFLQGELYVPGFVLEELQYIADSHDPLRRQRGRRGLEVLRHMQQDFPMAVQIHDRLAPEIRRRSPSA